MHDIGNVAPTNAPRAAQVIMWLTGDLFFGNVMNPMVDPYPIPRLIVPNQYFNIRLISILLN